MRYGVEDRSSVGSSVGYALYCVFDRNLPQAYKWVASFANPADAHAWVAAANEREEIRLRDAEQLAKQRREALNRLEELAKQHPIPKWIVIDEAHKLLKPQRMMMISDLYSWDTLPDNVPKDWLYPLV